MSTRYVDAEEVLVERVEGAVHLRITLRDDRCVLNGSVKRVFPLSDPDHFLSIIDGESKEVAILKTLDGLDASSHELLAGEIDRRYFTPRILRIVSLKQEAGMWKFVVDTQRGDAEFFVRNWRDSAVELVPGRWLVHSVDGGRFEIAQLTELDDRSQTLMDLLL